VRRDITTPQKYITGTSERETMFVLEDTVHTTTRGSTLHACKYWGGNEKFLCNKDILEQTSK